MGTLMRDVDCSVLSKVLTPNKQKLESKGIKSVSARIVNLKEVAPSITHENTQQQEEQQEQQQQQQQQKNFALMVKQLQTLLHLKGIFKHFRIGVTEDHSVCGGDIEFQTWLSELRASGSEVGLSVEKGFVDDCVIYSDCLYTELTEAFAEALKAKFPGHAEKVDEFAEWLAEASQS
ncbi:lipoate-protein ligase a, putative [Eimeria acervulina]|uniref:Lipoate-protein ligase a, putative n=1 Tax=Eimeria acervulina TaxID=5801 RepID=U6GC99_EIMAC|nr:lipoate-protein ligase a, putative [Eimeria acervulina]CDI77896.1 lipoate-protein ligase a, putative [Eimeria acervulina]